MQPPEFLELQMRNLFKGIIYFYFIFFFLSTNIKGDFQIWIGAPLIDFINSYPFSIFFSIVFVNIYLSSTFFSIVFSNIYLCSIFFARWKGVRLPTLLIS